MKKLFLKILRIISKFLIHLHRKIICLLYPVQNGLNDNKRKEEIIVSITTIPSRIHHICIVLEILLRQTLKPDKIIVYLDEKNKNIPLPLHLSLLQKKGISIKYRQDLKPHTKYYYAMQEYPNAIIITVDDDIYYPFNLIETLYHSYLKYPNCISAMRIHKIKYHNHIEDSYLNWQQEYNEQDAIIPNPDFLATGVGGILYPPHILPAETFRIENIKKYAYKQDDIWLKYIEKKNHILVVKASDKKYVIHDILGSQKITLKGSNINQNLNDIAIKNMREYIKTYQH